MTTSAGLRRSRIAAVLCGAAFAAVAVRVETAGSLPGDEWLLIELHDLLGTAWDDAMVAIGTVTDSIVLAAVAAAVTLGLLRARRPGDAYRFAIAVGVVLLVNPLLKELFERPRPDVRPSPESVSTFSFPSGHASGTAALAGAVALLVVEPRHRRVAVLVGMLGVAIVALSRLVIGVHYPSDIVAGWLWVAAWLSAVATPARGRR